MRLAVLVMCVTGVCVCVCVREFRLAAFTADLRDAMYPVVKHKLH